MHSSAKKISEHTSTDAFAKIKKSMLNIFLRCFVFGRTVFAYVKITDVAINRNGKKYQEKHVLK